SGNRGFALTNSGDGPLTITAITATGDFITGNNCGGTLAAGASCTVVVSFLPTATGTRTGSLSLSSNSSTAVSPLTLTGTGVDQALVVSPASLTFANQLLNTTTTSQGVIVRNAGVTSFVINGIDITGDFAQTNNCGNLDGGGICSISVTFTPTARGSRSGLLAVSSSSGAAQTVALSGTGVAPEASLSVSSLAFADQLIFTTSPQQPLTLTNSGNSALPVSSISVSTGGDFSQTNNCAFIAPAASCTINVTFRPVTGGTRSGTLTITDNSLTGTTQTVSLSGNGLAPQAVLSPAGLTFASQVVNTSSAAQTATLSNPGTATLLINSIDTTGDYTQSNNCGSSLAAGASCSINVSFAPTARGARSGALRVSTNAVGGNSMQVALSGSGIAPVTSLSASSLAFAAQLVHTTSPQQTVTLTNSGDATLNISAISLFGDFSQTNNCGSTVAAGASCTINVTFTPVVSGASSSGLVITDDLSAGGTQTV